MVSYARLSQGEYGLRPDQAWSDEWPPAFVVKDGWDGARPPNEGMDLARRFSARAGTTDGTSPVEKPSSIGWHPGFWSQGNRHEGFSVEELLDDVRRALECNLEATRAAVSQLVTFLGPAAAAEPASARGGLAPWQKRKVDRYLKENLDRPVRLNAVAEQVALSVSYFSRAFKETFGTTPHMHMLRLRLELAQKLMLTTEEPLSQIALACGLADQAHLSKLFRRVVGETPSAWRRRNLTDTQAEARSRCPTRGQFAVPDTGSGRIAASP
jgi:AraC family transcriptional regulator